MRRMAKNLQQGQVVQYDDREREVDWVEVRDDLTVVKFSDVGGMMVVDSNKYIAIADT